MTVVQSKGANKQSDVDIFLQKNISAGVPTLAEDAEDPLECLLDTL